MYTQVRMTTATALRAVEVQLMCAGVGVLMLP